MPLRPHQVQLREFVNEIQSGNLIKEIIIFAAPGGGKSLCPPILSDLLTNGRKQIWVVPRDALKYQGEADYQNEFYPVDKVARVADNSGDPFRGCDACLTTYQAIGANPEKWIKVCDEYDVMLCLDEFHHLSNHGEWISAIRKMKNASFLSVFMTGTISRGDNTKIPFVPYVGNDIDFSNTESRKWIIYSRNQALEDGSILPFQTTLLNGSGKYIDKEGIERSFSQFSESGDELRCAFKTEYAYQLIDMCIRDWDIYRKKQNWSKVLIVAPDIKTAKEYTEYLKKIRGLVPAIATSEDSKDCKEMVRRFKLPYNAYGSVNCLITVGIAYEGLSVPAISHMAILTLIRSIPWLEQCTARAVRNHAGKKEGFIFAPQDPKMLKALKCITNMIIQSANGEAPEKGGTSEEGGSGHGAPRIQALESSAHIDGVPVYESYVPPEKRKESQSEKEKRLRKEVNSVINKIVGAESAGNRKVKERIFWLRIKQIVNNGRDETGKLIKKPLKEFTVPELERVAEFASNYKN